MDIMTTQNERRVLDEAELDLVFGATAAEDREAFSAAVSYVNTLIGFTAALINLQLQHNMDVIRNTRG